MGLERKQPLVSCKPSVARISSSDIAANRQRLENTVEDFHYEEKFIDDRDRYSSALFSFLWVG